MPLLTVFNNESGAAGKLKSTGHVNESYIMHYKIKHYTYYKKLCLKIEIYTWRRLTMKIYDAPANENISECCSFNFYEYFTSGRK